MTIICATDFSIAAVGAVRAAAAIAARRGEGLRLIHVETDSDSHWGKAGALLFELASSALHETADMARKLGAEVTEEVASGDPPTQILAAIERAGASLVVVASHGRRAAARWFVGSVAEDLARRSPVPVLVVRDPDSLVAWARRERPLAVTVADDLGESSTGALRWTAGLGTLGETRITVAHVAWPPALHEKLGVRVSEDLERLRPEVEATLRAEIRGRAAEAGLPASAAIEVQQGYGRPDSHLGMLADQKASDLLVVGSHQRAGFDRLWKGSVSYGVLHLASQNVACVPARSADEMSATPTYRSILAATDFSAVGNAAIPHAFAIASPGATVHLLHVVEGRTSGTPAQAADDTKLTLRLARLVPRDAAARGVEVACHVGHGHRAEEILAAAARVGADVVCLGSQAHSALTAAVLGSVARAVVLQATRPVLIARPPEM